MLVLKYLLQVPQLCLGQSYLGRSLWTRLIRRVNGFRTVSERADQRQWGFPHLTGGFPQPTGQLAYVKGWHFGTGNSSSGSSVQVKLSVAYLVQVYYNYFTLC